jgi:5-formyltetrahydrofolate cyclo-ligase
MNKKELRKLFLQKRKELSQEERAIKSQRIHDLLFSRLMMHRYDRIHIYLPILSKNEVDTEIIINTLLRDFSPTLFAPKITAKGIMTHHEFHSLGDFAANKLGIPEPKNSNGLSHEKFFEIDDDILVIVPLLTFDKKGYRVGYGGGFYDRFLAHKTENTTTVGLSFFEAEDKIPEQNEFDIPINHCVTSERVSSF